MQIQTSARQFRGECNADPSRLSSQVIKACLQNMRKFGKRKGWKATKKVIDITNGSVVIVFKVRDPMSQLHHWTHQWF